MGGRDGSNASAGDTRDGGNRATGGSGGKKEKGRRAEKTNEMKITQGRSDTANNTNREK